MCGCVCDDRLLESPPVLRRASVVDQRLRVRIGQADGATTTTGGRDGGRDRSGGGHANGTSGAAGSKKRATTVRPVCRLGALGSRAQPPSSSCEGRRADRVRRPGEVSCPDTCPRCHLSSCLALTVGRRESGRARLAGRSRTGTTSGSSSSGGSTDQRHPTDGLADRQNRQTDTRQEHERHQGTRAISERSGRPAPAPASRLLPFFGHSSPRCPTK